MVCKHKFKSLGGYRHKSGIHICQKCGLVKFLGHEQAKKIKDEKSRKV